MPNNQDDELWELLNRMDAAMPDEEERPVSGEEPDPDYFDDGEADQGLEQMFYRNAANGYGQNVRNYSNNYGRGQTQPRNPAPGQSRQPEPAAQPQPQRPAQSRSAASDETQRFYPPEHTAGGKPTQAQRAAGAPTPPIRAYNADFRRAQAEAPQPEAPREETPKSQTYYEAPRRETPPAPPAPKEPKKKKRRKGCGCLTVLMIPVLILALLIGSLCLYIRAPKTDDPIGARKAGTSAILLCGADLGGVRTDTMMILYVNSISKEAGLMTLPRDTYTRTAYGLDVKLNSAYGRNGGGEEGMEVLLDYVQDILGYRPDGYLLVELPMLEELIDMMGGVDFDVPTTVSFSQSEQHDEIYLEPGMQHLDGAAALAVLRFRYGYANQDLGRQDTQKAFLKAAMKQWLTLDNIGKLSQVLDLFKTESLSDLSTGNYLWFAIHLLRCGIGDLRTDTLPGYATYIGDQSFYVLYPNEVVELVNEGYNPYKQEITRADVNIVTED